MAAAIEIKNLTVEFALRRGVVRAIKSLSLSVEEGTVFGFLGPNGAGKTTTIHVLLGFLQPTEGEARIFGENVAHSIARRRIGYLSEHPDTYHFLTGYELLHAAGRLFEIPNGALRKRIGALLAELDLSEVAHRRIFTYSRGMLQRICLAQALINDPDLVILDEPTSGLDPIGRMKIREIISELRGRGKTVFFSSHELSEVELVCDRVVILSRGAIAAEGKLCELVPAGESLEKFFLRAVAS